MKKRSTSSPSVFIMENLDKKVVRKYKRKHKTPYPITVPEHQMLKLLGTTRVKHPRLLKKRLRYFEEQFIEGKTMNENTDNTYLINIFTNYIYELRLVNASSLKKYIKWNNNSEFFHFQVDSFSKYVKKYKFKDKLAKMGLSDNLIDVFKSVKMDDNRKMYLIHGDFHRKNVIERYGEYFVIDWEHATYGDLAFEIAMHFTRESYSEEHMKLLIDRICTTLSIDPNLLIRDIRMYRNFEKIRRSFDKLNKACELQKERKDFRETLDEAYETYKYLAIAKTKDELRKIIVSKSK